MQTTFLVLTSKKENLEQKLGGTNKAIFAIFCPFSAVALEQWAYLSIEGRKGPDGRRRRGSKLIIFHLRLEVSSLSLLEGRSAQNFFFE